MFWYEFGEVIEVKVEVSDHGFMVVEPFCMKFYNINGGRPTLAQNSCIFLPHVEMEEFKILILLITLIASMH